MSVLASIDTKHSSRSYLEVARQSQTTAKVNTKPIAVSVTWAVSSDVEQKYNPDQVWIYKEAIKAQLLVPSEQREAATDNINRLFHKIHNIQQRLAIYRTLASTDAKVLASIAACLVQRFDSVRDGYLRADVIRTVSLMAGPAMPAFADKVIKLFEKIAFPARLNFTEALKLIPPAQRALAFDHLSLLMKCRQSKLEDLKIIFALGNVPMNARTHVLSVVASLFDPKVNQPPLKPLIPNGYQCAELITLISLFTPQQCNDESIAKLIKSINRCSHHAKFTSLHAVCSFIPPESRLAAIKLLHDNLISADNIDRACSSDALVQMLMQNDEIRTNTLSHLQNVLSSVGDITVAYNVSCFIITNQNYLQLKNDDIIFQMALEAQAKTQNFSAPNNPYIMHAKLKKITQEDKLLNPTIPTTLTITNSPDDKPIDVKISLDLAGCRKRAAKPGYVFSDLPEGIPANFFEKLFIGLEKRLEDNNYRDAIESAIEALCSDDVGYANKTIVDPRPLLTRLKEQTTAETAEITKLLKIRRNPEEAIENAHLYLYTVLNAIKETCNKPVNDSSLSQQEEMFLKFCNFVRNCSIGQKDGFAEFYNHGLTSQQRHPKQLQASVTAVELIENSVDAEMQLLFSKSLADEMLHKKLLPATVDPWFLVQSSHNAVFLPNRFARQLGMIWRQAFDPYTSSCLADYWVKCTEVIDDQCSGLEAEDVLEQIIKQIQTVILPRVKRALEQAIQTKTIKHGHLVEFFEKIRLDINADIDWPAYIHYDNDLNMLGLTDAGVLEVLRGMGYIKG